MTGSKKSTTFLVVLVVALVVLSAYLYSRVSALEEDPQLVVKEITEELIKDIGDLIVLPEDELPTVATVADPEQLSEQPFFANAKEGDKVLIYTNAKKAILYDPVGGKIVEVAPLNIGDAAESGV